MKTNKFFNKALKQAVEVSTRKNRLLRLASQLAHKIQYINWESVSQKSIRSKFFTLGRLSKAYALGDYREIPWRAILAIVAAIIYFINPIDIIPDMIPIAGLTDDFGVLVWVYGSVSQEINKFLEWEKSQISST